MLVACAPGPEAQKSTPASGAHGGAVTRVELPASVTPFPAGDGAIIANSQCLACHSVDMVLLQPPLTPEQWKTSINKMRNAYGASLPAEQVDPLAAYLTQLTAGR
jgi:hypothetical protein